MVFSVRSLSSRRLVWGSTRKRTAVSVAIRAAAAGVSSSALLRQAMARTGVWTPTAADIERARGREVARADAGAGAHREHLNQIARWANQHKSAADTVEVSRHLAAIELALRDLARSGRRS